MLGLTMIESTGISGRLPVLFAQVKEPQSAAQVTWKTWPAVAGVLVLNPPTAAYPTGRFAAVTVGSSAIPCTGRRGRTVLSPVTFTQLACDAVPVPRLKPIQTFASFVPSMATLEYFGEYFT
jgi:hypothetical protein